MSVHANPQYGRDVDNLQADNKRVLEVAESTKLTIRDRVVRVAPDAGDITLELPSCSEAEGYLVTIFCPDVDTAAAGAASKATITGVGLASDLTLAADEDGVVLYSDGFRYWVLADEIASE